MEFITLKKAPMYLPLTNYNTEIKIKSSDINDLIFRYTKNNISFITLFGSAIISKQYQTIKKKFLFFNYEKSVCITPPANDIDILVVTIQNIQPIKVDSKVSCKMLSGDSYGCYWVTREIPGLLHIQIASEYDLEKALLEQDKDAISIIGNSVLLEGNESKFREFKSLIKEY